MRFGANPGELHTAAAAVSRVGERTRAARETLSRIDPTVASWCADPALANDVINALDALDAAARSAGAAATSTASALVLAAENYHRADSPVPR